VLIFFPPRTHGRKELLTRLEHASNIVDMCAGMLKRVAADATAAEVAGVIIAAISSV
jgi:hypothetical protein